MFDESGVENTLVENYQWSSNVLQYERKGWYLRKNTDDKLQMEINTESGKQSVFSTIAVPIGEYVNISFTYDGEEAHIFINGNDHTELCFCKWW